MTLKPDGISQGWRGVIYDNEDPSRTPVWQCLHHPPHPSKISAKACAFQKLQDLGKYVGKHKVNRPKGNQ